ncbi:MAG: hypothetical protein ACI4XA_05425 [Oscillospiraceae bacterium]
MATVGNTASTQILMAKAMTNYSAKTGNSAAKKAAQQTLDELMKTKLKGQSDYFKEQYSSLYKSIYGITDEAEEKAESTVSLKTASASVSDAANSVSDFARNLKYGGEYDSEEYAKLAQSFADKYNSFIEKVGDAENQSVLQKGVIMVNTAKVYSSSLKRAGFTLGSDNKLTFDKDKLSKISATDIKSAFGTGGFTDKTAQKAQQIKSLSASEGAFGYGSNSSANYAYSIGALLNLYA